MALGGYKDIYTVDKYKTRVADIKSSLSGYISSSYFSSAKQEIERQITILRLKEKDIFEILNVKDLAELNTHLQNYRNAMINLSGPLLNQEIIYILKEDRDKQYQYYQSRIDEIISDLVVNDFKLDKDFRSQVLEYLKSNMGARHTYTSNRGIVGAAQRIIYASLTSEQQKAWRTIINKLDNKGGNEKIESQIKLQQENKVQVSFNWKEVTQNKTATEAQKDLSKKDINRINLIIIRKILDMVPSSERQLVNDIIVHKILAKNRYAFFVGNNISDIIGILGEIQGLYYVAKLLNLSSLSQAKYDLDWVGGTIKNGSKPHQDIILDRFGIQVKNSLDQDFHEINFNNASVETILQKTDFSEEVRNILLNYYGTLKFNVPYRYDLEKKEYVSVNTVEDIANTINSNDYINSYSALKKCNYNINLLLSLCASAFLYMDVSSWWGISDANSLYLLGGAAFVTASSILEHILEAIDSKKTSIKFRSSYADEDNPKNIISALNEKIKISDYSTSVIDNIVLKSSFDFSYLNAELRDIIKT